MRRAARVKAYTRMFTKRGYKVGAEIGAFKGSFSRALLNAMPELTMFCVDCWETVDGDFVNSVYDTCIAKLKPFASRCHIVTGKSPKIADAYPDEYFDFVYIDADHGYEATSADIKAWFPKVGHGGVLAGDDYVEGGHALEKIFAPSGKRGKRGVIQAVDEFVIKNGLKLNLLKHDNLNWWVDKL